MFHCVCIFYTSLSSFQWLPLYPMELPQLHRTTNQIHSEWKHKLVLWVLIKILPDQYLIFPELFLMTVTMTSTIACSRKYEGNVISMSASRVKWNYHHFERMTSLTMTYGDLPCGSSPIVAKHFTSLWSGLSMRCWNNLYMGGYRLGKFAAAITWAVIISFSQLRQQTN